MFALPLHFVLQSLLHRTSRCSSSRSEEDDMVSCGSGRDLVIRPKPRRLGDPIHPSRFHPKNHTDINDLKAESELLDIIFSKGSGVERSSNQVAMPPPFFSGSPPCRVSNPQVQDEHFGSVNMKPFSPVRAKPPSPSQPSSSSSTCKGECARMKFGPKPAMVRIEGFDCLSRDRQNCSISAVA